MNSILRPIYSTRRANASIGLGRSQIEITSNKQQIQCNGEAKLFLQPRIRLVVTADLSKNPGSAAGLSVGNSQVTLRYGTKSSAVNVLVSHSKSSWSATEGARDNAELLPDPQRLTICPNRRKWLKSVWHWGSSRRKHAPTAAAWTAWVAVLFIMDTDSIAKPLSAFRRFFLSPMRCSFCQCERGLTQSRRSGPRSTYRTLTTTPFA